MALTQNDYRSILGSLRNSGPNDSGSLRLGSYVQNLITPVGDDTIYNPTYHTGIEDYKTKTWYPVFDSSFVVEGTFTIKKNTKPTRVQIAEERQPTPYIGMYWTPKTPGVDVVSEVPGWIDGYDWSYGVKVSNNSENDANVTVQYLDFSYTIENGTLQTQFSLKKNTSYVLQVIDVETKNNCLIRNASEASYNDIWNFDNYLFFRTGDSSTSNFVLQVNGLSFGYTTYGKDVYGQMIQLRSVASPLKGKVFLFESDLPWVVDRSGQVVGAIDAPLEMQLGQSSTALPGTYDKKSILKILNRAPEITVEDWGGLTVTPVLTKEEQEIWNTTWNENPSMFEDIGLMAVRNYLTPCRQRWNNTIKEKQYGLYRTFQHDNAESSSGFAFFKFHITPRTWDESSSWVTSEITLSFDSMSFAPLDYKQDGETLKIHAEPFNLPILSLGGKNYYYDRYLDIPEDEKYKHTSFSLVWVTGNAKSINVISDYSIPIIIERGLCSAHSAWDGAGSDADAAGNNHCVELKPGVYPEISKENSTDYYPHEAIYIKAVYGS